jgi:hypothetical protein
VVMLDEDEEGTTLLMPTPIKPSENPAEAAGALSGDGGVTVTSSLAPSPPGTQPRSPDFTAHPSLSRQTTLTTMGSFSSLNSEGIDDIQNEKLSRILSVVQEAVFECRICWVSRTRSGRPHDTYRCSRKTCSGGDWVRFKSVVRFPRGKVCFFCFAPFSEPFNHAQAPVNEKQSPDQCEYPDVLKELAYIIYEDASLRRSVFEKLGHSMPSKLNEYVRFITGRQSGGIFGLYEVVFAYIGVREEDKL